MAASNGHIILMQYDPSYGNGIFIQHSANLFSYYWHLESWDPELYQTWLANGEVEVSAGQVIGTSGRAPSNEKYHVASELNASVDETGGYRLYFGIYQSGPIYLDPLNIIPGNYAKGYCYVKGCTPCGSLSCCFPPPTATPTPVPTPTPTLSPTPTLTPTATPTPTFSLTPTPSNTPTASATLPLGSQFACLPEGPRQVGVVTNVIDSNTIEVLIDGVTYTVDYIGVEISKTGAQDATQANRQMVLGKTVTLIGDSAAPDTSTVLFRYVIIGNTFVNDALIRSGHATAADSVGDISCGQQFQDAEETTYITPEPSTEPPPPPPPAPTIPPPVRCGAVCATPAGYITSATGAGACAYHDGVVEWLYVGDARCP
jgi:endonuclease YncB( thermonuclease family)